MDGVLVNNTRAHVRAFEIFCKRYGVEEWQRKLQTSFGMGNDDIMRQILPEEIIREKGLKALGEEKEAIYREVYAPEIRPVRGLVDLLEELRRRGIPCAVGSPGCASGVLRNGHSFPPADAFVVSAQHNAPPPNRRVPIQPAYSAEHGKQNSTNKSNS